MAAKKGKPQSVKSTSAIGKTPKGLSDDERLAMKERLQELKAEGRRGPGADKARKGKCGARGARRDAATGSRPWRAAPCDHQSQCARPRAKNLVRDARVRPGRQQVVCFFQSAAKFKARYATLGFQHDANLDEGAMWPVAFALKNLTAAEEARISDLVKKAVRS